MMKNVTVLLNQQLLTVQFGGFLLSLLSCREFLALGMVFFFWFLFLFCFCFVLFCFFHLILYFLNHKQNEKKSQIFDFFQENHILDTFMSIFEKNITSCKKKTKQNKTTKQNKNKNILDMHYYMIFK